MCDIAHAGPESSDLFPLLFLSTSTGFGGGRFYGGGEYFASEFLQAMARRKWRIELVCPPQSPMWRDESLIRAVRPYALDLSVKVRTPLRFLGVLLRWRAMTQRLSAPLLYANGFEAMKWVAAAGGPRVRVCHLHESTYEAYNSPRARSLARRMDLFFAISSEVRQRFIAGARVAEEKVRLVHNGVAVSDRVLKTEDEKRAVRSQFAIPPDAPLVFMAARTNVEKGHEVFLRAAYGIRDATNACFLIAGLQNQSGEEAALYRKITDLIRELDLHDRVKHTGHMADVRRLMRAADVVVVPSINEGFGRTAIEAMAEQTPVIVSRVGGLAEIVTDGVDGIQILPGDHMALGRALLSVLKNPGEGERLGLKGYATARTRFSLEAMTEKIESSLLEVMRRCKRPALR